MQSVNGDNDGEAPADARHHTEQQPRAGLLDEQRDRAEPKDEKSHSNGASQHVLAQSQFRDERLEFAEVCRTALRIQGKRAAAAGCPVMRYCRPSRVTTVTAFFRQCRQMAIWRAIRSSAERLRSVNARDIECARRCQ